MTSHPHRPQVLVLGAGIIGLSSALRIQESCPLADVTVMAEKFTPYTCSDGAAGFWEVFAVGNTDQKLINSLAAETHVYMTDLALSPLARISGVQQVSGYHLFDKKLEEELLFKDDVDGYRPMTEKELTRYPTATDGRFYSSLTMDVSDHLRWLTNRIQAKGCRFIQRKVKSLQELSDHWDIVVNCTALGSYHLLNDTKMFPIRGQVFRVHAPWAKQFCIHDHSIGDTFKLKYVFPNFDTVVVGGCFQVGKWHEDIDKEDTKDIWKRACEMMPSLKEATILKEWAGLRPARESMRLEPEVLELGAGKKPLRMVHNYGHGGAGITVHWGCARRSAEMVADYLRDKQQSSTTGRGKTPKTDSKL